MKKNLGIVQAVYPMPVLIVAAYNEQGVPNVMNAAWGGMFTDETIGICLSAGHKTTKNILATRAFTVSMATVDQVTACDYAGIVSGNKVPDKFARAGFHATPSTHVNAPMIDELPMTLECELLSYDPASCHLTGRIVNISADESILTDGQIDLRKLRPISFDPIHLEYIELGATVDKAFSCGKKLKERDLPLFRMYDPRENRIIIDGEDKTDSVERCLYTSRSNRCCIIFYNFPKIYSYVPSKVSWLKKPMTFGLPHHHLRRKGHLWSPGYSLDRDYRSYTLPEEIVLQLSHRDVYLEFFKEIKREVLALQSGDPLQYRDFTLYTEKTDRPVAKLSARMQKTLSDDSQ